MKFVMSLLICSVAYIDETKWSSIWLYLRRLFLHSLSSIFENSVFYYWTLVRIVNSHQVRHALTSSPLLFSYTNWGPIWPYLHLLFLDLLCFILEHRVFYLWTTVRTVNFNEARHVLTYILGCLHRQNKMKLYMTLPASFVPAHLFLHFRTLGVLFLEIMQDLGWMEVGGYECGGDLLSDSPLTKCRYIGHMLSVHLPYFHLRPLTFDTPVTLLVLAQKLCDTFGASFLSSAWPFVMKEQDC